MSGLVIFDTSIFIDHLRTNRHRQRIEAASGLIRTSSVVLAELWRGATWPAERAFPRVLQKNHPILTPTERHCSNLENCWEHWGVIEAWHPKNSATCISTS